jgi:uncharacterized protein YuzE
MKIEYDPEADALYIQIRQAHPSDNIEKLPLEVGTP